MMRRSWSLIPLFFSSSYTTAFTWQLTSQPSQCQNLSVAVNGSGQPPYSFLLIPNDKSPLPNGIEVRTVQNIPFPGNSTSLTFNLNYPENSSFVAVVTDSSGSGTGVVSTPVTVLESSDSSCYNPTQTIHPPWTFNAEITLGFTQCDSVRWWWLPKAVNGTVNFYGVIPGGNLFSLPEGSLSTDNTTGTGFEWTIDIAGGTNVIILAGDDRGIGSGGSVGYPAVSYSSNTSCLRNTSPSSTAGTPPGSYPTSTDNRSNGRSGKSSNTGAIAGGVAGGLALMVCVALIAFFYARRRGYSAISTEHRVLVLHDYEDDDRSYQNHPYDYELEPYVVPDINVGSPSVAASTSDRLLSTTSADIPSTQASASTNNVTIHKRALPPRLRPVNIVQHNDAGPSGVPSARGAGEHETIELPPAYTNIGSVQSPHGNAETTTP
ncbi:hypothetical protein EI94DRAFT_1744263 [Lactarius quietus]|nr:hypothetical protein EI94DRAFT_1744263 [Lactarius quietus]